MKRVMSLCVALVLVLQCIAIPASVFAADGTILFSEDFSSTATNGFPSGITLKGHPDSRVIESGRNKVLSLNLSKGIGAVSVPMKTDESVVWFAAKYKNIGDLKMANLFSLVDSSNVKTRLITLDGSAAKVSFDYALSGIQKNKWNDIAICLDYKAATYTVYVNGKCVVENWLLEKSPGKSKAVEFEFFPTEASKATAKVEMDDIRIYTGEEMIKLFPAQTYSTEVLPFEETVSTGVPTFYKQTTYDGVGITGVGGRLYNDNNREFATMTVEPDETKNNGENDDYLRFARTQGDSAYIELFASNCTDYNFVLDVEIKVFGDTCSYYNNFFAIRDTTLNSSYDFNLNENGDIEVTRGKMIYPLKKGEWNRLCMAYDFINYTVDLYINNELVLENHPMHVATLINNIRDCRVTCSSKEVNTVIGLDNFYWYEGEKPLEDPAEMAVQALVSMFEGDEKTVKSFVGNHLVYCTQNGNVMRNGVKTKGDAPGFLMNDRTMVPVRAISEAFDLEVGWEESTRTVTIGDDTTMQLDSNIIQKGEEVIESDVPATERNDRTYLPLRVLCEQVLGKSVHWDPETELIFIRDGEITIDTKATENLRMTHRHLLYDRATVDEFKEAVNTAGRPRIMLNQERVDQLKEFIKTDLGKEWFQTVQESAETYYNQPVLDTVVVNREIPGARTREQRITAWGLVYLLTGEEKYAERAWREVENMVNAKDWAATSSYLMTGAMLYTAARAYDWFYDYFSEEQKTQIADAIKKLGLMEALKGYSGQFGTPSYVRGYSNWSAVCNGPIMEACMAIGDREDSADFCAELFQSATLAFEYVLKNFAPDGAWMESFSYGNYTLQYLCPAMSSVKNTFGHDFGWGESPGFKRAGWSILTQMGPVTSATFHDSGGYAKANTDKSRMEHSYFNYWFADYYDDPAMTAAMIERDKWYDVKSPNGDRLIYINPDHIGMEAEIPQDNYFKNLESISLCSTSTPYNDECLFLWAHAGEHNSSFAHADSGSFEFAALGEQWIFDLGCTSDYSQIGYLEETAYPRRTEGKNLFLINPEGPDRGQVKAQYDPCTQFVSRGDDGAFAIYDLTNSYSKWVNSAKRGFMMPAGRECVIIRDEIDPKEANSQIYSFMHTRADIEVVDNKYAILSQDGKQVRMDFLVENAQDLKIYDAPAENMDKSLLDDTTADFSFARKIAISYKATGKTTITTKITPLDGKDHDFTVPNDSLGTWGYLIP